MRISCQNMARKAHQAGLLIGKLASRLNKHRYYGGFLL